MTRTLIKKQLSRHFSATPVVSPGVVVVGGGRMGGIRLSALSRNPKAQLAGFVDASEEIRARVSSEYGIPTFADLKDAVTATDAKAVWISAPTFTHMPLIADAVECGVHIATEKPVSESLSEINKW